jgi:prepilin peptidase CpaA
MTVVITLAAVLGVVASVGDVGWRRVPNWLTVSGAAAGLACASAGGWRGLALGAAGVALGFLILMPFHWCHAMGGGDVKLMAAFGALLGPGGILLAGVFAAILGGVAAAAVMIWKPREPAIPYAPAIVLGAWISLLGGGW